MRMMLSGMLCLLVTVSAGAQGSSRSDALFAAARSNDFSRVRALLAEGTATDARDEAGATPLMHAVYRGHLEAAAALVEGGAQIHLADPRGRTAWTWAAYRGHEAILRLFLENGAGADATIVGGVTALMVAALQGHPGCVDLLLQAGADPKLRDQDGKSAADWAAGAGHREIARRLAHRGSGGVGKAAGAPVLEEAGVAIGAPEAGTPADVAEAARQAAYLSAAEYEVVVELNRVRTDPAGYAEEVIRPLTRFYRGNLLTWPGEIPIRTQEGLAAVEECYRVLRQARAVKPLTPEEALSRAAADQTAYQGPRGEVGHAGPGGDGPAQRVRRYDSRMSTIGENISYGYAQARRIVVALLVDDGVPSRGHRENIMRREYTLVGVSIGEHMGYGHMCSPIDFGARR